MALEAGSRLGPYEIRAMLGAGGMGEVYLARDERLGRDVAVKVLPESFAANQTALARFEREARAVAALAHPNIVAIYDLGSDGNRAYAAMEHLEGETLRQRLEQGALPARKATELARQIARGLGAAHDRGIVHRDLKPENVFLTRDGQAKILDFGLAAERGPEPESGPADGGTMTRTSLTAPGTVMGTAGYMAPEQVRGEPVDHRADVFAFGCLLYEMLTGRRAFERDTGAETMTAILREEPTPLTSGESAPDVTPALQRVIERCLEKNRDERFQSARDLAFAIDTSFASGSGSHVTPPPPTAGARTSPRGWVGAAAGLALGALLGWALAAALGGAPTPPGPVRVRALTMSGTDTEPTASPDGQLVAFRSSRDGTARIWVRQMAGGGEQPLTDGPDISPRFSPDGSTLLFLRDEGDVTSIYRQAFVGGQPKKLVNDATEAAWAPDGARIAFVRTEFEAGELHSEVGLADAQAGGGETILAVDSLVTGIHWAPDGESLIAVEASVTGNVPDSSLIRVTVPGGAVERIRPDVGGMPISGPVFVGPQEVVMGVAGSIVGDQGDPLGRIVRTNLKTGEVTTLLWAEYLFPLQGLRVDFTVIDVLRPGTLVFHRNFVRQSLHVVDLAADGGEPTVRVLTRSEGRDRQPVYSPDGRHIVFSSNRTGNLDLWSVEIATGTLRQLTDDAAQDWDPGFTPDGRRLLWSSDRTGHLEVWSAGADGSGARMVTDDGVDAENPTMGGDGEWIVYWSANPEKLGVWKIRPDGTDAQRLAEGPYLQPQVSPDGRYAAFVQISADELRNWILVVDVESAELLPFRVAVPAPLDGSNIILGRVRWMPGGEALAYVGIDDQTRTGVFVQDFDPREDTSGSRRKLVGFWPQLVTESFDVAPDGRSVAVAVTEETRQIMLAEDVPGVAAAR